MFGLPLVALLSLTSSALSVTRIETLTPKNFLSEMAPGWNLGNTLEAIPTQTSWGNPVPNLALFKAIRKAGFKSVRIPIAWSQYASPDHVFQDQWMSEVERTVKLARDAGLVVMINVHWDGGWLQPSYKNRDAEILKFKKFWSQIATKFKNFDERLIFAGTNEVHMEGVYSAPTAENLEVQNGFNQDFVSTVRGVGGKNASRFLVIQGYNTDIDHTISGNSVLPTDSVKQRLAIEVHYYSPYNFTLNGNSPIWQWGAGATDPKVTDTWGNEAFVDEQFAKMKRGFAERGVPVILGEYAAMAKPKITVDDRYRIAWTSYVTQSAIKNGMVPMYWDTGAPDGLFDRATGQVTYPAMVRAIVGFARK